MQRATAPTACELPIKSGNIEELEGKIVAIEAELATARADIKTLKQARALDGENIDKLVQRLARSERELKTANAARDAHHACGQPTPEVPVEPSSVNAQLRQFFLEGRFKMVFTQGNGYGGGSTYAQSDEAIVVDLVALQRGEMFSKGFFPFFASSLPSTKFISMAAAQNAVLGREGAYALHWAGSGGVWRQGWFNRMAESAFPPFRSPFPFPFPFPQKRD